MPKNIVKVGVEVGTNPPMLPSANTPEDKIVYELFKEGTEPTEISTAYSKLDAPTNFSLNYKDEKINLSWDKVTDPGYKADGVLGYYIYFNDTLVGFTTKTNYTIDNLDNYIGTYSIKTGYKDTDGSKSNAVSKTLKETISYDLILKNNNTGVPTHWASLVTHW